MEEARTPAPDRDLTYNQVAGDRSLERIGALSDGLFAIAMTIVVLEIRVPAVEVHSDASLLAAIGQLGPRFLTYFLSFLTLGIFWNAQHAQLNYIQRADRNLAWLQLAYLSVVALMPFSTTLLAEFIDLRVAFVVYWLNIYLLGVALYVIWLYAIRSGELSPDATAPVQLAFKRRIVAYQAAYGVSAILAMLITPYVGIVVMLLTQLNSAIAPRLPWASRL
jgi:TMEM175 potassium channel family protein